MHSLQPIFRTYFVPSLCFCCYRSDVIVHHGVPSNKFDYGILKRLFLPTEYALTIQVHFFCVYFKPYIPRQKLGKVPVLKRGQLFCRQSYGRNAQNHLNNFRRYGFTTTCNSHRALLCISATILSMFLNYYNSLHSDSTYSSTNCTTACNTFYFPGFFWE